MCASHFPELQITGGIHARGAFPETWSQLELRSARCVSMAVLLAKESCQTYTDLEPSEAFQYFASLSSSTWHKLGASEPGRIYLLFYNLAILSEDLRIHDFNKS